MTPGTGGLPPAGTPASESHDLVIVGGGIGGIICLKYALDAGLDALLLERAEGIGGLWRTLPAWQDIQIRKEDWTLGDLPIAGEDQPSILHNIQAWAERFDLAPGIRLGANVRRARPRNGGWRVSTDDADYDATWLIAATGAHNRPVIPEVERIDSTIVEHHSSDLHDPEALRHRRVTVVGGGASAYDLLDLCFRHDADSVTWVYRNTRWMRPTRRAKYFGTNVRTFAKQQMLGVSVDEMNRVVNEDLRARYARAGITGIMPDADFDFRHEQLIPGRPRMIENFERIRRHRGEVVSLRGDRVVLSTGERPETDLLLWGTGYTMDLGYLDIEPLAGARRPTDAARRCYSGFLSTDADNLFLLAPAVLESNTSTPWAYAHVAKSIMSHIRGRPVFVDPPRAELTNHIDLVKAFAPRDRKSYWPLLWRLKYLWLALYHPREKPLPLP